MEIIKDLPDGVVGIAAKGKITHEDYIHNVIPAVEKGLEHHEKINFLFHISDFDSMELAVMWDDTKFGLSHWTDFSKIALVTDEIWVKNMTAFFAWMIPAEVRVFSLDEADQARAWLALSGEQKAA